MFPVSSSDPLRKLRDLDRSAQQFPNRLIRILDTQRFRNRVAGLQHDDSVWLIEYLDTSLDVLIPATPAYRVCLRELRAVCGARREVPQSCMLQETPSVTAKWPFTFRGPSDIYEGSLGDSKVYVKRLQTYADDEDGQDILAFCQEAVVWKRLKHPTIVPFLGANVSPLQLISVWMIGGELPIYVNAHPCADRLGLMRDVADGLNYLHSHGVIHGDLKGPGVLVDGEGHARLTDFGFSAVFTDTGSAGSIRSRHLMRWTAPEVLDKQTPVTTSSDVYSFSMVAIEAFTGNMPFHDLPSVTTGLRILSGKRPPRPTHPDFTDDLWGIINRCWHQEPLHRPNISEVVLCLRKAIDRRCDRIDVDDDDQATDDASFEGVPEEGPFVRLPHRTLFSRVFQLCGLERPSEADDGQYTGSEYEKPLARQYDTSDGPPRGRRFWFLGCKPFTWSRTNHKRSEKEKASSANRPRKRLRLFAI